MIAKQHINGSRGKQKEETKMIYAIALRNTKRNCMEVTNIEFGSKEKALEWKLQHDAISEVECWVVERITPECLGDRVY